MSSGLPAPAPLSMMGGGSRTVEGRGDMDLLSEIQLGLTLASALTEHHAKAQRA